MTAPIHTGKMRRHLDGVIRGELRDKFGWGLAFVATPDPNEPGAYNLAGEFAQPAAEGGGPTE
jgi:hypothetical protein